MYFKINKYDTPCNSNKPHTKSDICMVPSGNMQGGLEFIILRSIKKITRQFWDKILITDTFIDRVNLLGKYQPEILLFTDHKVQLIIYGGVEITLVDRDEN